jgi:hypothetical protein
MMAGDERVLGGSVVSRLQGRITRVLPDAVKAKGLAPMTRPGGAEDD